jgi:hypothetical protein
VVLQRVSVSDTAPEQQSMRRAGGVGRRTTAWRPPLRAADTPPPPTHVPNPRRCLLEDTWDAGMRFACGAVAENRVEPSWRPRCGARPGSVRPGRAQRFASGLRHASRSSRGCFTFQGLGLPQRTSARPVPTSRSACPALSRRSRGRCSPVPKPSRARYSTPAGPDVGARRCQPPFCDVETAAGGDVSDPPNLDGEANHPLSYANCGLRFCPADAPCVQSRSMRFESRTTAARTGSRACRRFVRRHDC